MICNTSVRYSVHVNDFVDGSTVPSRGLREGCTLSPYLFILCAQGILSIVDRAVRRGTFMGPRFFVEH